MFGLASGTRTQGGLWPFGPLPPEVDEELMALNLALTKLASLETTYCPASWDAFLTKLTEVLAARFPDSVNLFNYGPSTPTADERDRPWIKTDSLYNLDRLYTWSTEHSAWVSPHPSGANSGERRIWTLSEAALWAFDGGDGTDPGAVAPTATTGAMWEVDTDFEGRVPFGADGGDFVLGATGGAASLTLTEAQLPNHRHTGIFSDSTETKAYKPESPLLGVNTSNGDILFANGGGANLVTGDTGDGEAVDITNPHKVVYYIKRTARQFYTA